MKKKTLALFLSCALAVSMLSGCGSKDKDTKEATESSQASETDDQAAADEVAKLIDDIYVQERTDKTDEQCAAAKAAWDKLTEEQQNILMEAGKVASQFNRTISEEAENKVLEELKADGINVVEVPDIKPWQDACKGIIESSTKDQAELYQQILDMNK